MCAADLFLTISTTARPYQISCFKAVFTTFFFFHTCYFNRTVQMARQVNTETLLMVSRLQKKKEEVCVQCVATICLWTETEVRCDESERCKKWGLSTHFEGVFFYICKYLHALFFLQFRLHCSSTVINTQVFRVPTIQSNHEGQRWKLRCYGNKY